MTQQTYYRKWTDGEGIERVETVTFPSSGAARDQEYAKRGFTLEYPEDMAEAAAREEELRVEEENDGLEELTVEKLKALADKEKVDIETGARKAEIVQAIRDNRRRTEGVKATQG
jgi:hypothetical protein